MGLFGRVVLIVGMLGAVVAVGALAAGRAGELVDAPVSSPAPAGDASLASTTARPTACPKLSQAAALPVWRKGGVAFGDVDGSGYRGRATIRYA